MVWRYFHKGWLNELINHGGVYRTAPATPGLLKISCIVLFLISNHFPYQILSRFLLLAYLPLQILSCFLFPYPILNHLSLVSPLRLSKNFFRTFPCISQDFIRTFLRLAQNFPRTCLGFSGDFLRTFSGVSHDFLLTFSRVSKTFPLLYQDIQRLALMPWHYSCFS